MTAADGGVELKVTAFLDNEDDEGITNPVHSTAGARKYGFRGPLIGGVTVWGWATPAILEAAGEEWLDRGWAEFVFLEPVYPDDELTIRVDPPEAGALPLRMTNQGGVECVVGKVGRGDAPWLGDLVRPGRMKPAPAPDPKPPILLAPPPAGDWIPMSVDGSVQAAVDYARESQRTDDPRFAGEHALLHPGWIANRAEPLLRHNFALPASIHSKSQLQFLAPAVAGQRVTVGAHLVEVYERRGHHIARFDCLVQAEDGHDLAHMRHTTIFRIAPPAERE